MNPHVCLLFVLSVLRQESYSNNALSNCSLMRFIGIFLLSFILLFERIIHAIFFSLQLCNCQFVKTLIVVRVTLSDNIPYIWFLFCNGCFHHQLCTYVYPYLYAYCIYILYFRDSKMENILNPCFIMNIIILEL